MVYRIYLKKKQLFLADIEHKHSLSLRGNIGSFFVIITCGNIKYISGCDGAKQLPFIDLIKSYRVIYKELAYASNIALSNRTSIVN